jgi:hypothetical protein
MPTIGKETSAGGLSFTRGAAALIDVAGCFFG